MRCPFCLHADSRVLDSREADDGAAIRRRRACPACSARFTTLETATLLVVKRSGVREPFSPQKVLAGVRKACQGRPVNDDDLAVLGQVVEKTVRGHGAAEVPSQDIGRAVLAPLRQLDEVAYLRFASVYRSFETLADFEDEIRMLRRTSDAPAPGPFPTPSAPTVSDPTVSDPTSRPVRTSTPQPVDSSSHGGPLSPVKGRNA